MRRAGALTLTLGACAAPLVARAQSARSPLRIGLIPTDVADVAKIEALPRPNYQTALTPDLVQPGVNLTAKYGLVKAAFPAQEIISPVARS